MDEKQYSKFYPRLVGSSPKKVIAVFVVFTIVMGLFATAVEMDTEEEAFQPDIPKQEYMSQVRDNFGSVEETVQIAFTAQNGDVFTRDALKDMEQMEQRLQEDEEVNFTLASTNEVPSGVMTLRSAVMNADQSLKLEDFIVQQAEVTEEGVKAAENQTRMFERMNVSLTLNLYLSQTFMENDSFGGTLGTRTVLLSMSDIVSEPRSWRAMEKYEEKFGELLGKLNPDSNISHENVSSYMEGWLDDMRGKEGPYLERFLNLTEGTKNMLDAEPPEGVGYQEEKEFTRAMTLTFFATAEALGHLKEVDFEGLEAEPPSLERSFEEEKKKLADMTDDDVKRTVFDLINYDSSRLNRSIEKGVDNFDRMTDEADKSYENLTFMEDLLNVAIQELEEKGMDGDAKRLRGGYLAAVKENQTLVNESKAMYLESKNMLEHSKRLAPLLNQMSEMIESTVSKDFSPGDDLETISAEIALGLVFMDPSLDNEVRLEAQERIIEIGNEISEDSTTEVRVSANQVMMEEINESANRSINRLLPIAFILVVIILLIVFRSLLETALSVGCLGMAIVWTFGFGVVLGYQFNPMIVAVPILITGLVIDYGIHMVMRYREEKDGGYRPKGSTIVAISTVGGALVLTTFTTAVGFLSNTLSNIQAMQQFGVLAALGIISSFFLMTAFLPAVIQIYDERKERKAKKAKESEKSRRVADKAKEHGKDFVSGMLSTSADAADGHPMVVFLVVGLLTIFSIYGAVNIDSTFDIEDFLPEDQPQSKNMEYLSDNFNVTTYYAYVLTEGDLDSPEYLYALEETAENIANSEMVGGEDGDVESPLTVLRDYGTAPPGSPDHNLTLVRTFTASDNTGNDIPDENVTELYNMLYEFERSRDAIQGVLNRTAEGEYTTGIIRLKEDQEKITSNLDNAGVLEEDLEEAVKPLKEGGFAAKVTSSSMITEETTSELMDTQFRSLLLTILIVALTLSVIFYFLHRSFFLGVITTIPVALITLWIIGTMYLLDVSLNVMTVSITALTVGMGIDYSIHITHRFMEETSENHLYDAMHETVQNTGAALFGSATTTVAAFAILATSEILPLAQFGYITALALLYSFIVSVFVLPSGLMLWAKYRQKIRKKK